MPANSRWDLIRRLRVNPHGIFYAKYLYTCVIYPHKHFHAYLQSFILLWKFKFSIRFSSTFTFYVLYRQSYLIKIYVRFNDLLPHEMPGSYVTITVWLQHCEFVQLSVFRLNNFSIKYWQLSALRPEC